METVERHGQFGDIIKASTFSDYRPVGDLVLPFKVVNTLGPLVTIESAIYDVALDSPVDMALFDRPEGVPAAPARNQPTVADGAQKVEEIVPALTHGVHKNASPKGAEQKMIRRVVVGEDDAVADVVSIQVDRGQGGRRIRVVDAEGVALRKGGGHGFVEAVCAR